MTLPYTVVCDDSDEAVWKAHRWEGITASVLPSLLGLVPWTFAECKTDFERAQRLGQIKERYAQRIDSFQADLDDLRARGTKTAAERADGIEASAEAGERLEESILMWAKDEGVIHGETLSRSHVLVRSREWPWMMATPDAQDRNGLIEVKGHSVYMDKDWKTDVPDYYRAQVIAQLAVTGAPSATVIRWRWGIKPRAYPVPRVESEVRAIVEAARGVWDEIAAARKECGL